jgi:hypothetical protein
VKQFTVGSQIQHFVMAIHKMLDLGTRGEHVHKKRWRKSGQGAKWNFCLTAGTL